MLHPWRIIPVSPGEERWEEGVLTHFSGEQAPPQQRHPPTPVVLTVQLVLVLKPGELISLQANLNWSTCAPSAAPPTTPVVLTVQLVLVLKPR